MKNLLGILVILTTLSIVGAEITTPIIEIETPRLILRQTRESEIEKFHNYMQDPEVYEFIDIFHLAKLEVAQNLVAKANKSIIENGYGYFACEEKKSGEFMGYIGLNYITLQGNPFPCFTLSWIIDKKFWRQGFATEGANKLMELAFTKYNLEELGACTVEGNTKSRKVMERLGMQYKLDFDLPGVAKDHPHCKHVFYSISKEEYLKSKKQI